MTVETLSMLGMGFTILGAFLTGYIKLEKRLITVEVQQKLIMKKLDK